MAKRLLLLILPLLFALKNQACSPLNVPTLISQNIVGMNLNLQWSSNTTYNCQYRVDVEIVCNALPFTGNPPFYASPSMNKTTTPQNFPLQTIDMSTLCPGVTYKFRAREVYVPGPATTSAWTATFTFTVPGTLVAFNSSASGNPTLICLPQTSQLNATANGGCGPYTYNWTPAASLSNATISNPVASPTVTTTYTVTVTAACSQQTITSTVTIQVTVPPTPGTASVSPNPICAGQTVTLTLTGYAGNIQWQSGPTSGGPWTNIVGATTTPYVTAPLTSTTCFQAVVTGCGQVTSNAVCVTVNPAPNPNAGPAATICSGGNAPIFASGGGTYSWSPSTGLSCTTCPNPVASPTSTTTYTVTVTTNGCTGTSSVTITVNPLPTVTITPQNPTICLNGNVNLTANGCTSANWSPSTGLSSTTALTVTASPTTTTTYTVIGSNSNGCTASATVTVNVVTNVNVAMSPNDTICSGGNTSLSASGGIQYSWSPSGSLSNSTISNPLANPTSTTTYTVVVTTSQGCTGTGTVTITVDPPIILNLAGFPESCAGFCDGQGVCIPSGGFGSYNFLWSTGSTNAAINNLCNGTYSIVVTDAVGCSTSGSITVTSPPAMTLQTSSTPSICTSANGSATVNISGGTPNYTQLWSPSNQTTTTATGLNGGTYTVTVTDANGCTTSTTVVVPGSPPVTASIPTTSDASCFNGCNGTANAVGSQGTPPFTYSWAPSGGNAANATGLCAGIYTVTITDANGCTATSSATISQPTQLSIVSAVNGPVCLGSSAALGSLTNGGTPSYSYIWAPAGGNSANPTVTPTATTTYTVFVTDANGCTASSTVTVIVNPLPVVCFSAPDTVGCSPLGVSFTNCTANSSSCTWDLGDGNQINGCGAFVYPYPLPGIYTVTLTVTDNNGCVGTSTHLNMVQVFGQPVSCFTFGPQPATVLNAAITFTDCSTSGTSYLWNFGDVNISSSTLQNPQFTYTDTGAFVVQQIVCNSAGCCDTSSQTVIIGPDFTFFVPNAFTPDGDEDNDTFFPKGEGLDEDSYSLWIYDRWGNMMFSTNIWSKAWDGKAVGGIELVQEDVYIWVIKINDLHGKKHEYIGHVAVIR
jgi:trimeric autotransporter adhesin